MLSRLIVLKIKLYERGIEMNKKQNIVLTGTIILGILSLYIMQMGPSSILVQIKRGLAIESEVMLNMVVNIVFALLYLDVL